MDRRHAVRWRSALRNGLADDRLSERESAEGLPANRTAAEPPFSSGVNHKLSTYLVAEYGLDCHRQAEAKKMQTLGPL